MTHDEKAALVNSLRSICGDCERWHCGVEVGALGSQIEFFIEDKTRDHWCILYAEAVNGMVYDEGWLAHGRPTTVARVLEDWRKKWPELVAQWDARGFLQ
ncbi:MAG: hypothetical protein CL489_06945 [Acidobacteria bacterium]|nr:hypothetical protein [Acidobacteriota bacterium]